MQSIPQLIMNQFENSKVELFILKHLKWFGTWLVNKHNLAEKL
jgi:hypothetical protein